MRMDTDGPGSLGGARGVTGPSRAPSWAPSWAQKAQEGLAFLGPFWTLGARCAERLAWPVLSRPDLALTWPDLDLRGDRDVFSQL